LTPEEQLVVYRIVQESLTNVVRHSGASEARVTLRADGEWIEVAIVDDGSGLPAEGVPLEGGIRSMRERALLIGAELTWAAGEAGGTMIRLQVPVRAVPA
jgi:two-component system sensor histidine kinase UhpB